uniref:MATH domain-containing protein n=1 Tax=Caenorhabditis japonica TaxID=281687 RepID=A0A8R1ES85_CAEJA
MSMLQPLKDLSSNIVTLAFNIFNFEHLDGAYTSDTKEHNGIDWCVRVQSNKTAKPQKRRVSIFLVCNPNNPSEEWSVQTSFGFRIINSWGQSKNRISSLFYHSFNSKETSKGTVNFIGWDELTASNSGFLVDGVFQIEFDLNVTAFTGIKKEKISKKAYDEFIADGTLVMDGKPLNVCLPLLADNSTVLFDIFYTTNTEGTTTFEIFDFTYEAVLGMVSILQLDAFDITISNYRELLELGFYYQLLPVLDKCEDFLLKTKKVSLDNKLKLSEMFRLHLLQCRTLEQIKSVEQVDKILDDNIDLGDRTYEALLERLRYLERKESGKPMKCLCGRLHANEKK